MERTKTIIKTMTLRFVSDDFEKLKAKKGELTWEMFFMKSAKIK